MIRQLFVVNRDMTNHDSRLKISRIAFFCSLRMALLKEERGKPRLFREENAFFF